MISTWKSCNQHSHADFERKKKWNIKLLGPSIWSCYTFNTVTLSNDLIFVVLCWCEQKNTNTQWIIKNNNCRIFRFGRVKMHIETFRIGNKSDKHVISSFRWFKSNWWLNAFTRICAWDQFNSDRIQYQNIYC